MSPKLTEILHDTRITLLSLIADGINAFADVAKGVPQSKPEVSRHLNKLIDQGLIEKIDGYFITDLGKVVLSIVSPLNIITKHYEFFNSHSLSELPLNIIRNLDMLENAELIHGTGFIMNKMQEIGKIPTHEIFMVIDQPFPDFRYEMVLSGIFLVPAHMKLVPNIEEIFKQKYTNYKVRSIEKIFFPLGIINDQYGFLFFPDNSGVLDYNYCIYTEDEKAIMFIKKVWDYCDRCNFRNRRNNLPHTRY